MKKKFDVRPVDMCIYIDNHIYEANHDVEKIFNYLQCLFYALATKRRFFGKQKDYENYSLYGATHLYLRLTNKNQFLPGDDPKHIPKIKSVLNYIKHILYPLKVNYQQDNFSQVYDNDVMSDQIEIELRNDINKSNSKLLQLDTIDYLKSIPSIIWSFIKESPYNNDKVMSYNLYISVILTLLRSITLSNENYSRLFIKADTNNEYRLNVDNLAQKFLAEEKLSAPIIWHLDKGMESYIAVITNNIKKIIIKDIRELISYYEPSDEIIKDILMSPLKDYNEEYDD